MRDFKNEQEVLQYYQETKHRVVIFEGTVYDVDSYISQHPGGQEFLVNYLGKVIDEPFEEHGHTNSARLIFRDLDKVGYIFGDSSQKGADLTKANIKGLDGLQLKSTIKIDYNKGLYKQMLDANLSWDDYITFINEPKHLVNPIRDIKVFDNWFLELFTKTPWWGIPIAFGPIFYYHYSKVEVDWLTFIAFIFIGTISWQFTEYILHRFLFHSEDYWLPNHPLVLAHHFIIHGIHHAYPMDRYRLVMPIAPGYFFYFLATAPYKLLMSDYYCHPQICGLLIGYVAYDLIHYFLHHSSPKEGYFKSLKTYHMQHHYKNGQLGFGVSVKFWDYVFFTQID